jgi:hypothetical protein
MRLEEEGAGSLDPFDRANTRHYCNATMHREALFLLHIPKTAGTTLNRTTLHSIPRPGPFKNFCDSSFGIGRFLVNKIASAI